MSEYRGRLAPSPTGLMHLGHARTFWVAQVRARAAAGMLIMRVEDLDQARCRSEFREAVFEDLRWIGLDWVEGPDVGGPRGPYDQSARMEGYREAFRRLREQGWLFPCRCSRRDIQSALSAPHAGDEEPLYPGTCRNRAGITETEERGAWRFRVPEGEAVEFVDGRQGPQRWVAGRDFGDFVVWRHDGVPSYQLACVVDDAAMGVTEVVRGADLLLSTARQILLYRALGWAPPGFYHCPLVTDDAGVRLAKRHDALSLRRLREMGKTPEELRRDWE
ncbi:MAG: tRNA glutamyl-Q(34) synthetase GluQRS [Verrucomicrobiales bacterium]|nr:tRNA glutamyl-Q(34) synthetase GluQRS [Verrucomicrobiales bacterium]